MGVKEIKENGSFLVGVYKKGIIRWNFIGVSHGISAYLKQYFHVAYL
jgi:hypothetical protein